jgi:hypothetical protein
MVNEELEMSEIEEVMAEIAADYEAYSAWADKVDADFEEEAYTTWLQRQEFLLNSSEECTALVEF